MNLAAIVLLVHTLGFNPELREVDDVQSHFGITDQGVYSCLALTLLTDMNFDVCARVVKQESYGGVRGAMRLCHKWVKSNGEWKCVGGYTKVMNGWDLPNRVIRKKAAEVSEWQLRHSPSWSWIRAHNKEHGTEYTVLDMRHFERSLDVMMTAYDQLKKRVDRNGPRCLATDENNRCTRRCRVIPGSEEMVWLQYWNGCGSYRRHAKAVLSYREQVAAQ